MHDALTEYLGRCHCGALSARYRTAVPVSSWGIRACQCSFCRAHGALSTSDPAGALAFQIREEPLLQRYRFGLFTADFLICRECGIYVGAAFAGREGRFGVLNVRVLQPIPEALANPTPMQYGSEAVSERTGRRETRWTPLLAGSL